MEDVKTSVSVLPFWGRVSVVESPVDEQQKESGLILPWNADEQHLRRGVVVAVDPDYKDEDGHRSHLAPGTVIWFTTGRRVLDTLIVEASDIYAYET